MPHVVVKLKAGRSDELKQRLADQIAQAIVSVLGSSEASVSVAMEDVPPDEWTARVYEREIAPDWDRLYKKPGYGSRATATSALEAGKRRG
jgi:4-oxalocrotonate tautomerase